MRTVCSVPITEIILFEDYVCDQCKWKGDHTLKSCPYKGERLFPDEEVYINGYKEAARQRQENEEKVGYSLISAEELKLCYDTDLFVVLSQCATTQGDDKPKGKNIHIVEYPPRRPIKFNDLLEYAEWMYWRNILVWNQRKYGENIIPDLNMQNEIFQNKIKFLVLLRLVKEVFDNYNIPFDGTQWNTLFILIIRNIAKSADKRILNEPFKNYIGDFKLDNIILQKQNISLRRYNDIRLDKYFDLNDINNHLGRINNLLSITPYSERNKEKIIIGAKIVVEDTILSKNPPECSDRIGTITNINPDSKIIEFTLDE